MITTLVHIWAAVVTIGVALYIHFEFDPDFKKDVEDE